MMISCLLRLTHKMKEAKRSVGPLPTQWHSITISCPTDLVAECDGFFCNTKIAEEEIMKRIKKKITKGRRKNIL